MVYLILPIDLPRPQCFFVLRLAPSLSQARVHVLDPTPVSSSYSRRLVIRPFTSRALGLGISIFNQSWPTVDVQAGAVTRKSESREILPLSRIPNALLPLPPTRQCFAILPSLSSTAKSRTSKNCITRWCMREVSAA